MIVTLLQKNLNFIGMDQGIKDILKHSKKKLWGYIRLKGFLWAHIRERTFGRNFASSKSIPYCRTL